MNEVQPNSLLWKNDICQLCRTKYINPGEKDQHELDPEHKKKIALNNFLTNDLQFIRPDSSAPSMLYDRYIRAQAPIIGLNYLIELVFPWSRSPYWLCGLCYENGYGMDSADLHLYSECHRNNFIAETYPDRYEEMVQQKVECESTEHSNIDYEMTLKILKENRGIGSPPDVFNITLYAKHVALEKLQLVGDDDDKLFDCSPEEVTDYHQIFNCQTCGESIMSYINPEKHLQVWHAHCATIKHQKGQLINVALKEANISMKEGYPDGVIVHEKMVWASVEEMFYGPTCGLQYLIDFGDENFCKICNCLVSREETTNHFSCESHIANYLHRKAPSELFNIEYFQPEQRRTHLLALLDKKTSKHDREVYFNGSTQRIPQLLKSLAFPEDRVFHSNALVEKKLGTTDSYYCQVCQQYIWNISRNSWQSHIFDEAHIDCLAKRYLYNYDPRLFVNKFIDLSDLVVQNRGDIQFISSYEYGTEFIFQDEILRKFVCSCCYKIFDDLKQCSAHARSFEHVKNAIHSIAPEILPLLWNAQDDKEQQEILFDYMLHAYISPERKLRVYDPVLAYNLNCRGEIPKVFVELAKTQPDNRKFIVECGNKISPTIGLNTALQNTSLEILHISKAIIVFWCQECLQSFSIFLDQLDDIWTEHLFTRSHWQRKEVLEENCLNENYKQKIFSLYNVKPYKQDFASKKLTWKWNGDTKTYGFVLHQITQGVVERRHYPSSSGILNDLYCTLCGTSIALNDEFLEQHVRSFGHVFNFVHKYHKRGIPELEDLLLTPKEDLSMKRKNVRRYLTSILKSADTKYMPIFAYDYETKPYKYEMLASIIEDKTKRKMEMLDENKEIEHYLPNKERTEVSIGGINFDVSVDTAVDTKKLTIETEKFKMLNEHMFSEYGVKHPEDIRRSGSPPIEPRRRRDITPEKEDTLDIHRIPILIGRAMPSKDKLSTSIPSTSTNSLSQSCDYGTRPAIFGINNFEQPPLNFGPTTSYSTFSSAYSSSIPQHSSWTNPEMPYVFEGKSGVRKEDSLASKAEMYMKELKKIRDITGLVDYIKVQGYEPIVEDEDILFNKMIQKKRGALNANALYQVLCHDSQHLETYYCSLCDYWTTVSEMFGHLCSSEHRLKYMFRNYKGNYSKIMAETNTRARNLLIRQLSEQIWKFEGSGECRFRMKVILNEKDILRLWPDYENYVDNSWKIVEIVENDELDVDGRRTPITPPPTDPVQILSPTPQNALLANISKIQDIIRGIGAEPPEIDIAQQKKYVRQIEPFAAAPSPSQVEKTPDIRKMISLMVKIQNLVDQWGQVDEETLKNLCDEMDVPIKEVYTNQIFKHLKNSILRDSKSPPEAQLPPHSSGFQNVPDVNTFKALGVSAARLAKIIDKVHSVTNQTTSSSDESTSTRKGGFYGNTGTIEGENPYEEISLVYPTKDDDEESGQRLYDRAENEYRKDERIDDKINSLTFAFRTKNRFGGYNIPQAKPAKFHDLLYQEMIRELYGDVSAQDFTGNYLYGPPDGPHMGMPFRPPRMGGSRLIRPSRGIEPPYVPPHGLRSNFGGIRGPAFPTPRNFFNQQPTPLSFDSNTYTPNEQMSFIPTKNQMQEIDQQTGSSTLIKSNRQKKKEEREKRFLEKMKEKEEEGVTTKDNDQENGEQTSEGKSDKNVQKSEEESEEPIDGKEKTKKMKLMLSMGALVSSISKKVPEPANEIDAPELETKGMRKRKHSAECDRLSEGTETLPEEREKIKSQLEPMEMAVDEEKNDEEEEEGELKEELLQPKKSKLENINDIPFDKKKEVVVEMTEEQMDKETEYRAKFAERWCEYIRAAAENCRDPSIRLILHTCHRMGRFMSYKEDRFINFLKNSQKIQDPNFSKLIWNAIYNEYESDPNRMELPKETQRPPKSEKPKKEEGKEKIVPNRKSNEMIAEEQRLFKLMFQTYIERAIIKCRDTQVRTILQTIQPHANIPKAEEKFINFLKNSHNVTVESFAKKVWSTIMSEAELDRNPSTRTFMTNALSAEGPASNYTPIPNTNRGYDMPKTNPKPITIPKPIPKPKPAFNERSQNLLDPLPQASSGWLWGSGQQEHEYYAPPYIDSNSYYPQQDSGKKGGRRGRQSGKPDRGGRRGGGGLRGGRTQNQYQNRRSEQQWYGDDYSDYPDYDYQESYQEQDQFENQPTARNSNKPFYLDPNYMQYAYGQLPETGYHGSTLNQGNGQKTQVSAHYSSQYNDQSQDYGYGFFGQTMSSNTPAYARNPVPQPISNPVPNPMSSKMATLDATMLIPPPLPPKISGQIQPNSASQPAYIRLAEQIGNDWNSLGTQLDDLLNQF